jgi:hypothetical protein
MPVAMARAFTEWTVCPHKPIEKLADNLWRVAGKMPNGRVQRQMVLARLDDGRVIVNNAIALDDAEMAELEAWGTPSVIFVPNAFHRQDARIWKQRYPSAKVMSTAASKKGVSKVVAVDHTIEDAPRDDRVRFIAMDGVPAEAIQEIRSSDGTTTLVVCDAIMNQPKLRGPMGFFLGPTGRVSAPRAMRWLAFKDKRAFADQLDRLAETPGLARILVGHGKPIVDDPAGALRSVATQLR